MKKGKIILLNLVIIAYIVTVAGWFFNDGRLFYGGFGTFTVVLIAFMIVAMIRPNTHKDLQEEEIETDDLYDDGEKYEDNGTEGALSEDFDAADTSYETLEQISERFRNANRHDDDQNDENGSEESQDGEEITGDISEESQDEEEGTGDFSAESQSGEEGTGDVSAYRMAIEDLKEELVEVREELERANHELAELRSKEKDSRERGLSILPESMMPKEELDTINIVDVAKGVADELQTDAFKAGLRVQVSAGEEQILVRADEELLRVLFRNIVDNSIKYMNRQGILVITLSTIGDDLFVVLKDNGDGLDPEETNHIFELNYQGSNRISGNGLGLAQAKAVVEYYGGNIYAKSTQGGGMGIYIQLPTS